MVKQPQKQTTYADYLYNQIEIMLAGQGMFTLKDLADKAGLKVTGNMRRRVQHCVEAGTLGCSWIPVGDKGHALVFFRPPTDEQGGIPF